jgi:drug/metabolite transporter (DMT)-like permease
LFDLAYFIWTHDRLALDLMLVAILDMIGAIFIYRIVVMYKQHVVPMVTTIRKLLTSLFNIWYFKHSISDFQWIGFGIVLSAITLELYIGYREKMAKFREI